MGGKRFRAIDWSTDRFMEWRNNYGERCREEGTVLGQIDGSRDRDAWGTFINNGSFVEG